MTLPNHLTANVKLKCPFPPKSAQYRSMTKKLNAVKDGAYYRILERLRADFDEYELPNSIDVRHSYTGSEWIAHLEGDDPFSYREALPKGVHRRGSGYRVRIRREGQTLYDESFSTVDEAKQAYRLVCRL